jgi:PAS domain S-box-containing protein
VHSPGDLEVRSLEVGLRGDRSGPGRARRVVREVLDAAGRGEWIEAAELAVSELVTNVVLHARTDATLSISVGPAQVRVEVRDRSSALPHRHRYGEQATTGRGMALVASMTSACGATALPDGKVVWFEIEDRDEEPSVEDLLAAWDDDLWDTAVPGPPDAGAATGTSPVHLHGLPGTLWLAAVQHHDALLRELGHYAATHHLQVDFQGAQSALQLVSDPVVEAVELAARGDAPRLAVPADLPVPLPVEVAALDLTLHLPPDLGVATAALQDALDTAERLVGRGELLAFPGLPEVVGLRDWVCEQVQAQLAGVAGRAWQGTSDARFEVAAPVGSDDDLTAVVTALGGEERGVVAADESNRILAVSARLAALLGRDPEDLRGRRVVALIPPALREAHVAGFSRHLTSGRDHLMNTPLTLPVLHADGRELLCHCLIEQRTAPAGRCLYVMWIEPVTPGA